MQRQGPLGSVWRQRVTPCSSSTRNYKPRSKCISNAELHMVSTDSNPQAAPNVKSSFIPEHLDISTDHVHRRWFIGPMPEKAILAHSTAALRTAGRASRRAGQSGQGTGNSPLPPAIKRHAFEFFLAKGGNEAEWGEDVEGDVLEEMARKWRESDWGRLLGGIAQAKAEKRAGKEKKWVGGSFEVGKFFGVDILDESKDASAKASSSNRSGDSSSRQMGAAPSPGALEETFVTPPSKPGPPLSAPSATASSLYPNVLSATASSPYPNDSPVESTSFASTTRLLRRFLAKPSSSSLAIGTSLHPAGRSLLNGYHVRSDGDLAASSKKLKGKAKQVHYVDAVEFDQPASPREVLARSGSALGATSAESMATTDSDNMVMQDRMLIRTSYTKVDSVGSRFDEAQHRTTRHLVHEAWDEFLVAWRKDVNGNHWIELYENYSIPLKEWLLRHKHLRFIIPLRTSISQLSIYSFVDLTFCITCQPTSTAKRNGEAQRLTERAKEGTNIFVFKLQSRSRALDWVWRLWLQLGGKIPPSLEVRIAPLDIRINIDIPSPSTGPNIPDRPLDSDLSRTFTCDNVKRLCLKVLSTFPVWRGALEKDRSAGRGLELAWRSGANLDWIWVEEDADGMKREWAVLAGLALKQLGVHCHLELRKAEHAPMVILENGNFLVKPPSIEGYLDFIRPRNQAKSPMYLSSQEGLIFILAPAYAYPPPVPGVGGVKASETRRGSRQVLDSFGLYDLRNVLAVRRAFQVVVSPRAETAAKKRKAKDVDGWVRAWVSEEAGGADGVAVVENEEQDEGGDVGMARAADKGRLKIRRSFELLLTNGHVFRFETHSRRVAVEWVDRLRAIIRYWQLRHKVDAREEMDLAQLGSGRPRVTPRIHPHYDPSMSPEPASNLTANLPALGAMYNWCVLDGCSSIVKRGKLFMRRGLRGPYKLVELILVSSCLTQFCITPRSPLHHRLSKVISLFGAYVCSGYLATLALPEDQYDAGAPQLARRYQDGLEVDDSDEDTLFVVFHWPKAPLPPPHDAPESERIRTAPKLGVKRKLVVFRTRSRLERDAWCWAINCEIEKMMRSTHVKERLP